MIQFPLPATSRNNRIKSPPTIFSMLLKRDCAGIARQESVVELYRESVIETLCDKTVSQL
jgi:hypothetical protein